MEHEVEEVLDRYVRPRLREHGGDIAVTRIESGIVYVRMRGRCTSCLSAQYTLEELVERELRERVPGVREASVDAFDPELFRVAQRLLRHELPLTPPSPRR